MRTTKVEQEREAKIGGAQVVQALMAVSPLQSVHRLDFDDDRVLDKEIRDVIADDDTIVDHMNRTLLLYADSSPLQFEAKRIFVDLFQETKPEL